MPSPGRAASSSGSDRDFHRLTIVVPARNEARRIAPTLASLREHVPAAAAQSEIIIVDDASTDGTAAMCAGAGLPNLRVITLAQSRGKGAAVRAGLQAAAGTAVAFVDADNSAPLQELPGMIARLQAGADIVAGVRAGVSGPALQRAPGRRLLSFGLHAIARGALGVRCPDPQCGFKLMRGPVAREFAAVQHLDGFAFDLELLFLAQKRGWRVACHPVSWIDAAGSHVSPLRDVPRFLRDIVRLRVLARQGAYDPTARARAP